MTAILTLTLNPALDIATAVEKIAPLHKLRCEPEERYPGGGGINVARAVQRLGGEAIALFPAGGVAGKRIQTLLEDAHVPQAIIPIAGETRENFAVIERTTGSQFRFVLPGPEMAGDERQACHQAVVQRAKPGSFVVASGSLPRGAPADIYGQLARACHSAGVRFVLDTGAACLARSLGAGVDLIKPSFSEFVELTGVSPLDEAAALAAIRAMIARRDTRHVALSLGDRGAWLVGESFAYAASAPAIVPLSTIGAGDSFMAGLVLALSRGQPAMEALRRGVAAGAAALRAPGVELCRMEDVVELAPRVAVRALP